MKRIELQLYVLSFSSNNLDLLWYSQAGLQSVVCLSIGELIDSVYRRVHYLAHITIIFKSSVNAAVYLVKIKHCPCLGKVPVIATLLTDYSLFSRSSLKVICPVYL
jgi:hypothetical protein